VFSCFSSNSFASSKDSQKDAENFANSSLFKASQEIQSFDHQDLVPLNSKPFDGEKAREGIESGEQINNEIKDYLESPDHCQNIELKTFSENELFIENSDEIVSGNRPVLFEEGVTYSIEKCTESGNKFVLSYDNIFKENGTWEVNTEEKKRLSDSHLCHLENYKKLLQSNSDNRKRYTFDCSHKGENTCKVYDRDRRCQLLSKKCVKESNGHCLLYKKTFECEYSYDRFGYDETFTIKQECSSPGEKYTLEFEKVTKDNGEVWVDFPERERESIQPYCELKSIEDSLTPFANIPGDRETFTFLCEHPKDKNDCNKFKGRNCTLVKSECLKETEQGCSLYQNTFKCFSNRSLGTIPSLDGIYGLNGELDAEDSKPNDSFPEAATKLTIFSEMKTFLEESGSEDASKVRFFGGYARGCDKSIAADLVYDCCSNDGFAKQVGLAHCTGEELSLAGLRQKGLCHYVDKHKKGILNTQTQHTFCCFPSKLSRVLQEKGRPQLGISWGSSKNPNCSGFTHEQISKLNLSKLDLSEVYDDVVGNVSANLEEKLNSLKGRVQDIKDKKTGEQTLCSN
jgi:conjugal transfer mating pair stabilization protein TraN